MRIRKNAMLCIIFLLAATRSALACEFEIAPYLFASTDLKLHVAWSCKPNGEAQKDKTKSNFFELTSKSENGLFSTQTLEPVLTDGLYVATLPGNYCGFGESLEYRVTGMPEAKTISNIPCASDEKVRFTFLSDTQLDAKLTAQFAKTISKFPSQFLVHGGDVVQHGGDLKEWNAYFDAMSVVGGNRVTFPIVGNHEYRGARKKPLWNRFYQSSATDAFYSFDVGPVHMIVLNTNFEFDYTLLAKQTAYLESELKKPALWKVVAFHHPPYSQGIAQSQIPGLRQEHIYIRSLFVPLFEKNKVDLVLNGHVHLYERSYKNGVNYVSSGATGGQMGVKAPTKPHPLYTFRSEKVRTMIHVEATPKTLQLHVSGIDGKTIETINLKK